MICIILFFKIPHFIYFFNVLFVFWINATRTSLSSVLNIHTTYSNQSDPFCGLSSRRRHCHWADDIISKEQMIIISHSTTFDWTYKVFPDQITFCLESYILFGQMTFCLEQVRLPLDQRRFSGSEKIVCEADIAAQ